MIHPIYLIVAVDSKNGIGKNGSIPWHLPHELNYFQKVTTKVKDRHKQNMIVMGRTTWESIPNAHRPLKGRKNIVLTHNNDYKANGATVAHSLNEAYTLADDNIETVFNIGGGKVFAEALNRNDTTGIYLTRLDVTFDCDTYLPNIPKRFGKKRLLGKGADADVNYEYLLFEDTISL